MDVSPNQLFFHFFIDDEGTVWLSSTEKGVYHVYFPKKQFRTLVLPVTIRSREKMMQAYVLVFRAVMEIFGSEIA